VRSLVHKIEKVINAEKSASLFSLATLLQGLSAGYGIIVHAKNAAFDSRIFPRKKLLCVVISIGNITVGGTGKTPMTLYIANLIMTLGYSVVILSRGYKGTAEKAGGIVSDGKALLMSAAEAGDEPYMMASTLKGVPVVVGRNRYEAGNRAITAFSPDVILLDDGFQHIKLARDIDLVLVDHRRPFGNGYLLPRGPLREPVSALKRANIIIETRCDDPKKPGAKLVKTMHRLSLNTPVFQSGQTPHIVQVISGKQPSLPNPNPSGLPHLLSLLQAKRVFAFSGLAENRNFHRTLTEIGCHLAGVKEFPDHYWYGERDLALIRKAATEKRAELILTTQKDAARIPKGVEWPRDLVVIGITPNLGDHTDALKNYIKSRLLMGKSGVLSHASP
jgi:tetraacyldisaccharide 4'-kinase